jgi:hypothetical protein
VDGYAVTRVALIDRGKKEEAYFSSNHSIKTNSIL